MFQQWKSSTTWVDTWGCTLIQNALSMSNLKMKKKKKEGKKRKEKGTDILTVIQKFWNFVLYHIFFCFHEIIMIIMYYAEFVDSQGLFYRVRPPFFIFKRAIFVNYKVCYISNFNTPCQNPHYEHILWIKWLLWVCRVIITCYSYIIGSKNFQAVKTLLTNFLICICLPPNDITGTNWKS